MRAPWIVLLLACSHPPLPRLDPCVGVTNHANDGAYCGSSTANGFTSDPDAPNDLVTCSFGHTIDRITCGTSCMLKPGKPDQCNPDPCASVTVDGNYCGGSDQNGFDVDDASPLVLYTCANGTTTAAMTSAACL